MTKKVEKPTLRPFGSTFSDEPVLLGAQKDAADNQDTPATSAPVENAKDNKPDFLTDDSLLDEPTQKQDNQSEKSEPKTEAPNKGTPADEQNADLLEGEGDDEVSDSSGIGNDELPEGDTALVDHTDTTDVLNEDTVDGFFDSDDGDEAVQLEQQLEQVDESTLRAMLKDKASDLALVPVTTESPKAPLVVEPSKTMIALTPQAGVDEVTDLFETQDLKRLRLEDLPELQVGKTPTVYLRDGTPLTVTGAHTPADYDFLKTLQAHELDKAKRKEAFVRSQIRPLNWFDGQYADVLSRITTVATIISQAQNGFPSCLRDNPALCQHVATTAYRYGLDPFTLALSNVYSVNGGVEFYGAYHEEVLKKFAPIVGGVVAFYSEGNFHDLICYNVADQVPRSPYHAVTVYALADNGQLLKYRLSMSMISKFNSPLWRSNPRQQLKYSAIRGFMRTYFAGLFNGLDIDAGEVTVSTVFDEMDVQHFYDHPAEVKPASAPTSDPTSQLQMDAQGFLTPASVNHLETLLQSSTAENLPSLVELLRGYRQVLRDDHHALLLSVYRNRAEQLRGANP